MKKVAILTWLHNNNYGSILQAYALQKFLRDEKYEITNIDLCPSSLEKLRNCIIQGNPLISLLKEKMTLFKAEKEYKNKAAFKRKDEKFKSFLNENFILTHTYRKFDDLKDIAGKYDVYICGSDQIWSPMLLNPAYYLDFLPSSAKKVSYACSFGMDSIPYNKQKRIAKWLKSFCAISVREIAGQKIVKSLLGKDCITTVDPTMLLPAGTWNMIIGNKQIIDEQYLLCYFLSYQRKQWEKASEIAKSKGLKMVTIATTKESCGYGDIVIYDAGPSEWVNLMKNAAFVVTDSFHGSVFSIIYQRQFCVFKRFNDQNKLSQNSRIYTLLSEYGLKDVLVEDIDNYKVKEILPDRYNRVTELLCKKAEESKRWLINSILA